VKVPDQSFSLPEFPICLLFPTARPSSIGEKLVLYNLCAGARLPDAP